MESTDLRSVGYEASVKRLGTGARICGVGYYPLVSVVIATYNMGAYLTSAIDSVMRQTYRNIEVIVVDDGSDDETTERIKPYLGLSNFRYVRQSNLGQPRAKNEGIRTSRGELIAFCDADDIWLPEKLELQVPCFANRHHLAVVSTEVGEIDAEGRYTGQRRVERYSGRVLEKMLIKNFVPFGTALVRRDVLFEVGLFDECLPMGIDWDLWLRIALRYEFLHLDVVTYYYRVWPGQMSNNYRGRYANAFRILDKFFENHPSSVTNAVRRRAYADTYVGRGRVVRQREGSVLEPLRDYISALLLCPTYLYVWKSLGKLALGRR